MQKNEKIELSISGTTSDGYGVGRHENMAVFVPNAAEGDIINAHILKVKKNYAFAKIDEIITPSGDRQAPECAVSNKCGGCVYQHITYQKECEIKAKMVEQNMRRIGGVDLSAKPIIAAKSIEGYRNKAQYPVSENGNVGFYAFHSHRIIENKNCLLQPPIFARICEEITDFVKQNGISIYNEQTKKGLLRHIYLRIAEATNEIMAVLVINGDSLTNHQQLVKKLTEFQEIKSIQLNINKKDTNVILGERCICLYGKEYITDVLCGVKVNISPLSFYQVNRTMAETLYEKATEYAEPSGKNILDLYCGAGTIGLSMASKAKSIIGVEIIPEAVADAKLNAKQNGIQNAEFICGDAAAAAKELVRRKIKTNVVILDPPRKGCDSELLNTVAKDFAPERIVYVSCDSATLARDTAILINLGYILVEYTPVDLFPRTAHIETVAKFLKKS